MTRFLLLLTICLLAFTAGGFAPPLLEVPPPGVSIRASQRVCLSPCKLTMTVVVPRHPDNRQLDVAWGSDAGFGGAFSRDVTGEKADSVFTREIMLRAPGMWVLAATLTKVVRGKVTQEEATPWQVEVR